jgi:hypothetical protein
MFVQCVNSKLTLSSVIQCQDDVWKRDSRKFVIATSTIVIAGRTSSAFEDPRDKL